MAGLGGYLRTVPALGWLIVALVVSGLAVWGTSPAYVA